METKLDLDRHWQNIPKPKVDLKEPENQGLTRDLPAIYDLIALALQTDSTRVATLEIGGSFAASDLGIREGYHNLSHHGQVQANIDLLVQIELYQMQQFARFLEKLQFDPRARQRRHAARQHDGPASAAAWATPTRTSTPTCRSSWPAAASSTASTRHIPASSAEARAAVQSLCVDAPAVRRRDRSVQREHGHVDGTGAGLMCDRILARTVASEGSSDCGTD